MIPLTLAAKLIAAFLALPFSLFFIVEMTKWMRRLSKNDDHSTPIEMNEKLVIFRKHTTKPARSAI